jgi:hypothetical protein
LARSTTIGGLIAALSMVMSPLEVTPVPVDASAGFDIMVRNANADAMAATVVASDRDRMLCSLVVDVTLLRRTQSE